MIVCKNYQEAYETVENNDTLYWVFAELYTGAVPSTLPQDGTNIMNFPQNRPLDKIRFAAGSTLLCADTSDLYVTNDSGVWKKIGS